MKKRFLIAGMLCLTLTILSLAACGDSTSNESEAPETKGTTMITETTEAPVSSWESRLTALFQDSDDAGLTIEDLTFFGTPVTDLSIEDAAAIAQKNGFVGELHKEDDMLSYESSSPDSPSVRLTHFESETDPFTQIAYVHAVPPGLFSGRYETDTPVWVGIRDIHTFDSLEKVLRELNYSNSSEIAAAIQEIFTLPSEEALAILQELHTYGFCSQTAGYTVYDDTDRLTEWTFLWEATDTSSQKQYQVQFKYLVEDDCLTAVAIWIQ